MFRCNLKNDVVFICVDTDKTWLYLFKTTKKGFKSVTSRKMRNDMDYFMSKNLLMLIFLHKENML